jgi:uncharacterized protein YggU (UPF0235/DUF167 family)
MGWIEIDGENVKLNVKVIPNSSRVGIKDINEDRALIEVSKHLMIS